MSTNERSFINPYPDYDKKDDCTIQDLIDIDFWKKWVIENGMYCLKRNKPKSDEKYCDGGIYVGNLGLIYTAFKMSNSGYYDLKSEFDLKNYMTECLDANQRYYSSVSQKDSTRAAFLLGKG